MQEDSYYPFGMTMNGLIYLNVDEDEKNNYLYNGKELQEDFGLDCYDYGARFYDAQLGRWHVVDPMSESYISQSPYHFSGNNPINFVDLNGMDYDWVDRGGQIVWDENVTSANDKDLQKGDTYIAKDFVAKDQDGNLINFKDDGTATKSPSGSVAMIEAAGVNTDNLMEVTSTVISEAKTNDVSDYTSAISVVLVADDASIAGVIDDFLIPVLAGIGIASNLLETDAVYQFAKDKGKTNKRDNGLEGLSLEEIQSELKGLKGRLSKKEKARKGKLVTEEKARRVRNKQKRNKK